MDCRCPCCNETFRGNQLAFIAAKAALEYREQVSLEEQVYAKEIMLKKIWSEEILKRYPKIDIRRIGLIWGWISSNSNRILPQRYRRLAMSVDLL